MAFIFFMLFMVYIIKLEDVVVVQAHALYVITKDLFCPSCHNMVVFELDNLTWQ